MVFVENLKMFLVKYVNNLKIYFLFHDDNLKILLFPKSIQHLLVLGVFRQIQDRTIH